MAEKQLYPVFDIPSLVVSTETANTTFKAGALFDFDTGDFVRDGSNRVIMVDGRDSYMLWVLKALKTQYGACESYPMYGIDAESCLMQPNREAVQSGFERTITETLMADARTARVYGFEFEWDSDALEVRFIVKPQQWTEFGVNMTTIT